VSNLPACLAFPCIVCRELGYIYLTKGEYDMKRFHSRMDAWVSGFAGSGAMMCFVNGRVIAGVFCVGLFVIFGIRSIFSSEE